VKPDIEVAMPEGAKLPMHLKQMDPAADPQMATALHLLGLQR